LFVQAGGTVIALAHTNKHKDGDGRAIYEGTADVVADFDAAYTLELDTPADSGKRQVTFHNFKSRGPNAQKVSFTYDASEGKTWGERFDSVRKIDTAAAQKAVEAMRADAQLDDDRSIVNFLKGRMDAGPIARKALVQEMLGIEGSGSRSQRERVLDRYDQSNPRAEHRFWHYSTNAKGGKSYDL
jgi:hypothetical protein